MKAEIITITPELATKMLQNNPNNRKIRSRRVEMYARDMKAGKWNLTGQGITIAKDGGILDGQHRLAAVVLAGVPVQMLVVSDADRVATYDSGLKRSVLDQIKIGDGRESDGGVYSLVGSATARLLYLLVLDGKLTSKVVVSTEEILEVIRCNERGLSWICNVFQSGGSQSGIRRSVIPATLYAISRLDSRVTPSMIEHIAHVLYTGFATDTTDAPIIAFRNKLLSKTISTSILGNNEICLRLQYMVKQLVDGKTTSRNMLPPEAIYDFTKLQDEIFETKGEN